MRPYLLVAAVIIGATTALVGCSTLQRAVEIQSDLDGLTRSGVVGSIATLDDGTTTAVMTAACPTGPTAIRSARMIASGSEV